MSDLMVPVDTPAGSTLTHAELAASGVRATVWHLETLLMKPGIEVLRHFGRLRDYCGWQGRLVVNGAGLSLHASETFRVRSVFDGSTQTFTPQAIAELLEILAPDVLILPQSLPFTAMSPAIEVFSATGETAGVFARADTPAEAETLRRRFEGRAVYLSTDAPFTALSEMAAMGFAALQSDTPARDAQAGLVYTAEGVLNLCAPAHAMDYQTIATDCACSTCAAPFSRASLHHLYAHTPLLAKRLLMTHNLAFSRRVLPVQ